MKRHETRRQAALAAALWIAWVALIIADLLAASTIQPPGGTP